MKTTPFLLLLLLSLHQPLGAQQAFQNGYLGLSTGIINYEGDLKPNSFTFNNSNLYLSFFARFPFTPRISWKIGAGFGKVEADDRDNRDYLKARNLDFASSISELYTGIEIAALDISKQFVTPYVFVGGVIFHFNPYTFDQGHNKVFLKPLSTEGQGLADYPERKPYKLTQLALAWSAGIRFRISDGFNAGLEFNQRKTFTDYLDDVSSTYVDYNKLLQAKGQLAVDLAYRGDELPGGSPYPHDNEQRGTASEKDWYYMLCLTAEVKFSTIKSGIGKLFYGRNERYVTKCPSNF